MYPGLDRGGGSTISHCYTSRAVYMGTLLLLYPLRFLVLSMRATSTLVIVVAIVLYMAFPATEATATRMEID
jgi:hypothetical protein